MNNCPLLLTCTIFRCDISIVMAGEIKIFINLFTHMSPLGSILLTYYFKTMDNDFNFYRKTRTFNIFTEK